MTLGEGKGLNKISISSLVLFCCLSIALILGGCNSGALSSKPTSTATVIPKTQVDTIVSLTFDDGNVDNFSIEPLLKSNGLHATFYVSTRRVGTAGFMSWEQLQILQSDGNEIGGHTFDHIKVEGLDTGILRHQICDDRRNLLDHGLNAVSFAYPFGNYDDNAKRMVRDCGYTNARAVIGDPVMIPPVDPYVLTGFPYIVKDTELGKLERYVREVRNSGGGWIILIFHHVCDSCDFFSIRPDVMNNFIPWLAQHQDRGNLKVMTIGEVIAGSPTH